MITIVPYDAREPEGFAFSPLTECDISFILSL
jgi:hypothetical protein